MSRTTARRGRTLSSGRFPSALRVASSSSSSTSSSISESGSRGRSSSDTLSLIKLWDFEEVNERNIDSKLEELNAGVCFIRLAYAVIDCVWIANGFKAQ